MKVEQGTHTELLQLPVTRGLPAVGGGGDEGKPPGPISGGFYHNMWDTQMGEDTKDLELRTASSSEVSDRVLVREHSPWWWPLPGGGHCLSSSQIGEHGRSPTTGAGP